MRMINNLCIYFLFLISAACQNSNKPDKNMYICKTQPLNFICYLDASTIKKIFLNKRISKAPLDCGKESEFFRISKGSTLNSNYWFLDLQDSIHKNDSFILCIQINNKFKNYSFKNIVFDTMPVYGGYICGIKSYSLNGKFYNNGNFVLSDEN